jgi:hypothetical protein
VQLHALQAELEAIEAENLSYEEDSSGEEVVPEEGDE